MSGKGGKLKVGATVVGQRTPVVLVGFSRDVQERRHDNKEEEEEEERGSKH